jgi:hypothetical protein
MPYPFMTLGARHQSSPRASGPRCLISSLVFSSTIMASQLAFGSPTALESACWLISQPSSEQVHLFQLSATQRPTHWQNILGHAPALLQIHKVIFLAPLVHPPLDLRSHIKTQRSRPASDTLYR